MQNAREDDLLDLTVHRSYVLRIAMISIFLCISVKPFESQHQELTSFYISSASRNSTKKRIKMIKAGIGTNVVGQCKEVGTGEPPGTVGSSLDARDARPRMLFLGSEWGEPRDLGSLKCLWRQKRPVGLASWRWRFVLEIVFVQ